MNVTRIERLWRSGFVNRWHSNPDPRLRNAQDTTAAHAQRVAVLVVLLGEIAADHGDVSAGLEADYAELAAAILHDAPELDTGDVAYDAKRLNHGLRKALDDAEISFWNGLGMMAPESTPLVKMCDQLDAYLFVKHHAPDLLERDDWQRHHDTILDMATALGLRGLVRKLMT